MVLSKTLTIFSIFVLLLSVSIVLIERYLPEQEELRNVEELPPDLQSWFRRGKYYNIFSHKVFAIWNKDSYDGSKDVIILVHGFPASSFDYHRSLSSLESSGRPVLLFDHVGFGYSDKPKEGFVYSLQDHAEVALELWRQLGIKRAHIVAHDMGDSIVTEILTRRQKKMLPDYFNDFFQSVTFTNGGMKYDLINFRLSQVILRVPVVGPFLSALSSKLPDTITNKFARQQLLSIWGPIDASGDAEDVEKRRIYRDFDVDALILLNKFNGGSKITHKTIGYLNDRSRFEQRWFASLTKLDLPCFLLWGDSDAVSPVEIPKYLAQNVLPYKNVQGTTLKDTGHFLMLERPADWAKLILDFISKHSKA